jgi:hypothetical protein
VEAVDTFLAHHEAQTMLIEPSGWR